MQNPVLYCFGLLFQNFHFAPIGSFKKNTADKKRKDFCDWKSQPNLVKCADLGDNPRARQQDNQLTQQGNKKTVVSLADCLEKVGERNTQCCKREAQTDGAQRGNADRHHFFACIKHHQQVFCAELEDKQSHNHNAQRDNGGKL